MFYKFAKYIFVFVFFVSVWHTHANAQEINCRIDNISVNDGLSNNTVRSITQDAQGFMWFGTEAGLNRYDGLHFKIYYNKPNNINSLTSNMIQTTFKDSFNNLWIITSKGGVNRLNLENNKFTRYIYESDVKDSLNLHVFRNAVAIDNDNTLWFSYSHSGLYSVKLNTNEQIIYKHIQTDKNSISSNNVRSILVAANGLIWIGTDEGVLNCFDKKTQKFTKYFIKDKDDYKKSYPIIWKIFEDHTGLLWISIGDSLYTFNKETGNYKLILRSINKSKYYFSYGFVSSIIEDNFKNIWIGTDNGIYQYNRKTSKLINLHEQTNYASIFKSRNILSLYQDKTGIIWAGTLSEGVYKIIPSLKAFKVLRHQVHNPYSISPGIIRSIYYDSKGYLWVGTIDDGISILKNNKRVAHFVYEENNPQSISNNAVTGIIQDSKGNYWISTGGNGFCVLKNFNPDKITDNKFIRYKHNPENTNSISNDNVTVIFEDSKKNIWIGTNRGLDFFDQQNKRFLHPNYSTKGENSLVAVQSNSITEDKSGTLWVGTWYGLYNFDYSFKSGKITINNPLHFIRKNNSPNTITDNRITAIVESNNGNIWIGTYGGGLNKLDIHKNKSGEEKNYHFSCILMSNGLPSNEIYGMHSDKHNNLWMSTNNGISKFNIDSEQIKNYNVQDGLQSDIFFWGASHKSYKGEIFFGGINGLNYFYPDSIKKEDITLGIVFTNLKIRNKLINPGKNSALKKQINFAKQIILNHSFETFTIEFTALNYGVIHKDKYKFKLEGYNKEWVETEAYNKTATYTNLNPGNYVFKVVASSFDNPEKKLLAEIKIKVLSPFWKTWWFYGLEIIFFIIIILGLIKAREKKLKNDNKKLEQAVAERTLKIHQQHKEILAQNEEIKQHNEEIHTHNDTLNQYKNHLENLVKERTKSLQEALTKSTESERLKTAFLENLSHEIRTPLNAIVGFSQLLEDPDLDIDDQLKYINKIQFGSDSLLSVVDSIMYISKMQVGEYKLSKSEFILSELLQEQYAVAKKALFGVKNNKVKFIQNTNELENLVVYSDKNCLSLILTSMIDNAVKFTEKGTIKIEIRIEPDNMLQFMVKDTGIGIPKYEFDFVFDKFRKGEINKAKFYKGIGVGLALSKSLTDLLDGKIWFESEINKGSTFYFAIPYKKPQEIV